MVYIWDIFIRSFHFFLIYAMIGAYISSENGNISDHALWGITILSLLMFRILWGICGSYNARFVNFLSGPSKIISYIKNIFNSRSQKYMGHNPIGGLSVIAMLICLCAQSLSGLAMTDDIFFEGLFYASFSDPFLSLIDNLHRQNFNIILALIVLHISAIIFYLTFKKENLINPMVTGYKNMAQSDHKDYGGYKIVFAILSLGAAASLWSYLYAMLER